MSNPYGGVPDPRPRWGPGGYPHPSSAPPNPYSTQPYPGQPYPSQSYPGQSYPGQSYPAPYVALPRSDLAGPPRVQRPAVIGISASMTVTASLLWVVLLVFLLLVASAAKRQLSYSEQPEAALYHVADEFQVVMGNGLAWPLFGLPLVAAVAAFLLLAPRAWARVAYTALGVGTVGWSLFWLHHLIGWWVPAAGYVALAVSICWAPSVGRWHADQARRRSRATDEPAPGQDRSAPGTMRP